MEIHIEREMDGVGVVGLVKYNVEWREGKGVAQKGHRKTVGWRETGTP